MKGPHTKVTKVCDICNKKFSRSDSLKTTPWKPCGNFPEPVPSPGKGGELGVGLTILPRKKTHSQKTSTEVSDTGQNQR